MALKKPYCVNFFILLIKTLSNKHTTFENSVAIGEIAFCYNEFYKSTLIYRDDAYLACVLVGNRLPFSWYRCHLEQHMTFENIQEKEETDKNQQFLFSPQRCFQSRHFVKV